MILNSNCKTIFFLTSLVVIFSFLDLSRYEFQTFDYAICNPFRKDFDFVLNLRSHTIRLQKTNTKDELSKMFGTINFG